MDNHLEMRNHRKTPERYAILDAVYSMEGHFSLDELDRKLEETAFRVSRTTLYNTMKLFIRLGIVIRYRSLDRTEYGASYDDNNHCRQFCTVCGKVTEVTLPQVNDTIMDAKLRRFRKEGFSLYIYGICSSCQAKLTRRARKKNQELTKK